jgi:hypothetical protein
LKGSRNDNVIVGSQRLAHLARDIIAKMNLNSERDSLQFGERFAVLPEALDGDEQSIEQLALRWIRIVPLSRSALADEARRIACID